MAMLQISVVVNFKKIHVYFCVTTYKQEALSVYYLMGDRLNSAAIKSLLHGKRCTRPLRYGADEFIIAPVL